MLFGLGSALLIALPTTANAQVIDVDTVPARAAGSVSCKSKFSATEDLDAAFLHILNGTCYSCPTGFKRTINPDVLAGTACEKPGFNRHREATKHERATGLFRTDCPGNQFWHAGNGYCYSCPGGYRRTASGINSRNACVKRVPTQNAAARERGKPGCGDDSFRHVLSDNCWACPPGYARSASISLSGDLSELDDACVRVTVGGPAEPQLTDAHKEAFDAVLSDRVALFRQAAEVVAAIVPRIGELRAAIDAGRPLSESFRKEVGLNELANSAGGEGFSAITIGITGDVSVGMGGTFGAGFAYSTESWNDTWTYSGNSWSICCSIGADVAPEIGFFMGPPDTLAGVAHGGTVGGSYNIGAAATAWFNYCPPDGDTVCIFDNFLGFSVLPQVGFSAELEYVRGETRASALP